jgi:hypothetical protein
VDPLSRQCFLITVQEKGSDKMSFFAEARLPHQSNYSLTKYCTGFKACVYVCWGGLSSC